MTRFITFQSNEVAMQLQQDKIYINNEKFYRGLPFNGNSLFSLKCDGSKLMCALALLAMPSKPQWAIVYDHSIFKAIDFIKWHTHSTYAQVKTGGYVEYLTPNIKNVIEMVQISESDDIKSIQASYLDFLEQGIPLGCNEWAGYKIKPKFKWTDKDHKVLSLCTAGMHNLSMCQAEHVVSHILTEMVIMSDVQHKEDEHHRTKKLC